MNKYKINNCSINQFLRFLRQELIPITTKMNTFDSSLSKGTFLLK